MSDEQFFQDIYNAASATANEYNVESIYSIQVINHLINSFGRENIKWFYTTWNRIQKQYS
ncbi:hypothetical protein [Clostridium sp. JN-1]|jgi:hypothetical protein|uniref:hypothetical protein n=1 Tax=Clostridium sp. JN-1 TaxID=2483110 RepID=UPI000F0B02D0|nr:hypothetical protein [Clostridium sp. JN-1]